MTKKIIIILAITSLIMTGCQSKAEEPENNANDDSVVVSVEESSDQNESSEAVVVDTTEVEVDTEEQSTPVETEDPSLYECTDILALLGSETYDPEDLDSIYPFLLSVKDKYNQESVDAMVEHLVNVIENSRKFDLESKKNEFLAPFINGEQMLDDISYQALLNENADFQNFVNLLSSKGLKINYSIYWSPSLEVDFNLINEQFHESVSPEMAAYLDILGAESKSHYIKSSFDDLSRGISLDELVSRILMTENYLKDFPDSKRANIVKQINIEYLSDYLYGNTKYYTSFDWMDDFKLYDEFAEHYAKTIAENEGTGLAKRLKEFLKSIEENDGAVDTRNRMVDDSGYIFENYIDK